MIEPDRRCAPQIHPLKGMKLPPVERMHLGNGVEVVTLSQGRQPVNRLTVSWPVGTADIDCPEALRLLRLMLCEGAGKRSGTEIAELFEYNGAWIKVEAARHVTSVTLHSLNKSVGEVLPVMGDIITAPLLPADIFLKIREKEVSACALRRRKVEQKCVELSNIQRFGKGNPLALAITPELLHKVEPTHLHEAHQRIMTEVIPTVYVAGTLDNDVMSHVISMAEGINSYMNGNQVISRVVPAPKHTFGETDLIRDEGSLQTAIRIALPSINRENPDYELLRYTVFALGGYFGSRLMSNIREDKGYTYGITAALTASSEGAFAGIACQTDNKYAAAVIEEVEKEIALLASEPIGKEELDIVRSTVVSNLTSILDSPFSIMDYHQMLDLYGLPTGYYEHQMDVLMSLTPDMIMQCAAKHLADAPRLVALAGNPA